VPAVNGATNYVWAATGGISIISGNGTPSVTVSGTSTGNLFVVAQTACGNTNTSSRTINVSTSVPPAPILELINPPCPNYQSPGLLRITNYDPCATYNFTGTNGAIASSGGSDIVFVEIGSPFAGPTITGYGTNACGQGGSLPASIPAGNCGFGGFSLQANPNPSSSEVALQYTLPDDATVDIILSHPAVGITSRALANTPQPKGKHEVKIDVSRLSAGVYSATATATTKQGKTYRATCVVIVKR
jgi:hypothetical protein